MPWAINLKSLDAVVAKGAGAEIDTLGGRPISMVTVASSVTSGGTLKLEGSVDDGATWAELTTRNITTDGTYVDSVDYPMRLVRANLTRTDGVYTVHIIIPAAAPGWRE